MNDQYNEWLEEQMRIEQAQEYYAQLERERYEAEMRRQEEAYRAAERRRTERERLDAELARVAGSI